MVAMGTLLSFRNGLATTRYSPTTSSFIESVGRCRCRVFLPLLLPLLLLEPVSSVPVVVHCVVNDTQLSSLFAGSGQPSYWRNHHHHHYHHGRGRSQSSHLIFLGRFPHASLAGTDGATSVEYDWKTNIIEVNPCGGFATCWASRHPRAMGDPMVILPSRAPQGCRRSCRFPRLYQIA